LKDALSGLPEYQELKAKVRMIITYYIQLSLHTDLCTRAMKVYTQSNLELISELEQVNIKQ
jgi:hypothetical protein